MRKARYKLTLKERWVFQKELLGHTDKMESTLILANVIADKYGWPKIEQGQPKYKEFSKQYLIKYREINNKPLSARNSWVYFIREGSKGHLKIGVSDDIKSRLRSLQTATPRELFLIAKIGCTSRKEAYAVENDAHKVFKDFHVRGEWFASTLLFYMDRLKHCVEWENNNLTDDALFNKVERMKGKASK